MTPAHRAMVAFLAASLQTGRVFTRVWDHDARIDVPMGGVVRPQRVDVIDREGRRLTGPIEALLDPVGGGYIQLALRDGGFSGFDYACGQHFQGVFAAPPPGGAVQLFDHESGRYHNFHVR
jgi:hypothetical protein